MGRSWWSGVEDPVIIPKSLEDRYLEFTRDLYAEKFKGKVTSDKKVRLDSSAGRDFTIRAQPPGVGIVEIRAREYLQGKAVILLLVASEPEQGSPRRDGQIPRLVRLRHPPGRHDGQGRREGDRGRRQGTEGLGDGDRPRRRRQVRHRRASRSRSRSPARSTTSSPTSASSTPPGSFVRSKGTSSRSSGSTAPLPPAASRPRRRPTRSTPAASCSGKTPRITSSSSAPRCSARGTRSTP